MESYEMVNVPGLFSQVLRNIGCTPEQAIAELIDNSLDAGATDINVSVATIEKQISGRKKPLKVIDSITVKDNGIGMSPVTLRKSLLAGWSGCEELSNRNQVIGKYGIGMLLGALSLGRRIDIYTWQETSPSIMYTSVSLDDLLINTGYEVPEPEEVNAGILGNESRSASGCMIVISECDRLERDATEVMATFSNFFARTYRKFIEGGLQLTVNDTKVLLHDPLYLAGPTRFQVKNGSSNSINNMKADRYPREIVVELATEDGVCYPVEVKASVLPKRWMEMYWLDQDEIRMMKIDQNKGVSVLRGNREIYFGQLSELYDISDKNNAIDPLWGMEISFPPELDDLMGVRFFKNGISLERSVNDKLHQQIAIVINELRAMIDLEANKVEAMYDEAAESNADGFIYGEVSNAYRLANKVFASRPTHGFAETDLQIFEQFAEDLQEDFDYIINMREVPLGFDNLFVPRLDETGAICIAINSDHEFYKYVISKYHNEGKSLVAMIVACFVKSISMPSNEEEKALFAKQAADFSKFLELMAKNI